jgi:hypothetical protein
VGIAHHHGMSKGCMLSGNARPTLLQTYNCFYLRVFAEKDVFSVWAFMAEFTLSANSYTRPASGIY